MKLNRSRGFFITETKPKYDSPFHVHTHDVPRKDILTNCMVVVNGQVDNVGEDQGCVKWWEAGKGLTVQTRQLSLVA